MLGSDQPVVSILCPAYNHAHYIRAALDSFLCQKTSFPFEIIVHDDASQDSTASIIKTYELNHPDVFHNIYQSENQFSKDISSVTLNMLQKARGKYLAFCEGDDFWTDPYKLQKQVDLLEKFPQASMCVALIETLNERDGTVEKEVPFVTAHPPLLTRSELKKYFHTSTYCMRKSEFDYVYAKYKGLILSDTAKCFLMIDRGPFVLLNEIVSCYRITNKGMWTGADQYKKDQFHYALFRKFRKHYKLNRYFFFAGWERKMLLNIVRHKQHATFSERASLAYLRFVGLIERLTQSGNAG